MTREKRKCPHCGSEDLNFEDSTLVCTECGAIIEEEVVSSEQEPFYSYEDVVKKGKHSFASQTQPKTRTEQRNLHLVISLINDLVNKLHLPYFIGEDAISHYKHLMRKKKLRKDIVPSIAAALVYLVCRRSRIPLPFERVSKESEIEKSDLASSYMEIIELLKLEVPPPSIEGLTIQLAKNAGLKPETIALSRNIAGKLKKELILGKDPNSIAAAAVCVAAEREGEKISKTKMAQIASVSDVTLRNQLVEIEKALKK